MLIAYRSKLKIKSDTFLLLFIWHNEWLKNCWMDDLEI